MYLDPFLYLFDDYIWYLRTVNNSPKLTSTSSLSKDGLKSLYNGFMP